jgi:hypothetical protein
LAPGGEKGIFDGETRHRRENWHVPHERLRVVKR